MIEEIKKIGLGLFSEEKETCDKSVTNILFRSGLNVDDKVVKGELISTLARVMITDLVSCLQSEELNRTLSECLVSFRSGNIMIEFLMGTKRIYIQDVDKSLFLINPRTFTTTNLSIGTMVIGPKGLLVSYQDDQYNKMETLFLENGQYNHSICSSKKEETKNFVKEKK